MCEFRSGSSIDSVDHPICFYVNTMQFLLLYSVEVLEIRGGETSRSSFILCKIILVTRGVLFCVSGFCFWVFCFLLFCFLPLHMKLGIVLSRSGKNCVGILMRTALNL